MTIIISRKLTTKEAKQNIHRLKQWFRNNPRRKVCYTDLWKVRKNFIEIDVLKHTKI